MSVNSGWAFHAGGVVLALLLLGFAVRAGRRLRFLIDTPTSKAKGVFIGQVEISGRAQIETPVRTFLAEKDSAWFRFKVTEEWERWETETTTDSKGNTESRQVRRTGWDTVAQGGETPPFFVVDETGSVLVRPEGADIEPVEVFRETVGPGDPLYYAKGPATEIANSNHRRHFLEEAILPGAPLFVAGRARERQDVVAPEIAADKTADLFLISCREETKVQRGFRLQFWILGVLALLPLPVAGFIAARSNHVPTNWQILGALVAGVVTIEAVAWLWMTFNSLIQLRNRTAQAWSLVDVQLKRRSDLIPQLVSVVVGLRDHEEHVQVEVAALRSQAGATPPWQPGADVAAAQSIVRAVVERYPELKTHDSFLRLQRELSETETRVALSRDYYNEIATHQNTRLEIMPDRWVALFAGLKNRPLLGAEGFERASVTVKLTLPS